MANLLTDDAVSESFKIMSAALKELDCSLRKEFGGTRAGRPQAADLHHGILSVGREPIVMWTIFRALLSAQLPAVDRIGVRWEHPYPRNTSQHMDLAFVSTSSDDGKPLLLGCIEAKGFDDRPEQLRIVVNADIEKMSQLPSDVRRFVLAFSFSKENTDPSKIRQWWEIEPQLTPRSEWRYCFDTMFLDNKRRVQEQRQACVTLLEVQRDA